ncbi:hypothetical protein Tco_0724509, partial [Tanacetum coccineum]
FQLQTKKKQKKVIDSNLNENGLDGDDTNNIKRGNAQTAGSSSCDSDVDLDGGADSSKPVERGALAEAALADTKNVSEREEKT